MGSDSISGDSREMESDPIVLLGMRPHPEGGWYAEVHRSADTVEPADGRGARAALTSIYFLLVEGKPSRWHRVTSDEVWIHLQGAPLALHLLDDGPTPEARTVTLGPLPALRPQHTVVAGQWQAAQALGPRTLVACVVGPGFEFDDFTLMDPASALAGWLRQHAPALAGLI
jgi:uncharacterized protein